MNVVQSCMHYKIMLCPFFVYRLIKIKEWVDRHDPGALVIPFSGALELKLQEMSAEEKQKYLEENMTQRLISIHFPYTLLSTISLQ